MNLISRFELAALAEAELRGLMRDVFNALARSEPDSPERRNALAPIDCVTSALVGQNIGFEERRIFGSSKPLCSEDEQENRNIEGRG